MSNIFNELEMENQSPEEVIQSLEKLKDNNIGKPACVGGYIGIDKEYCLYYRNGAINLYSVEIL